MILKYGDDRKAPNPEGAPENSPGREPISANLTHFPDLDLDLDVDLDALLRRKR